MTDEKNAPATISDPYQVPVVFANQLAGSGFLNGNVNLTLSAARFTPNNEGGVDPDLVIVARLRMDLFCAQQLYERLGAIISETVKGETKQ